MRELLEAGVHFGHQTRRWNPKMRRYIFAERGGIYIIDLQKTQELLEEAHAFGRNLAERGGTMLFVGTKKQAQDAVAEHAARVGMPYVNNRWLGGLLTNWRTISDRIAYLHDLRRLKTEGQLDLLPSKERIAMTRELEKLEANLGGVADMKRQPDAVFVIDLKKEQLAVREARRLGVPVVGLVDTNADPDEADFVIPGNDDAIRSCNLSRASSRTGSRPGRHEGHRRPSSSARPEAARGGAGSRGAAEAAEEADCRRSSAEAEPTAAVGAESGEAPNERHDQRIARQGAPRPHGRGDDGLQARPRGDGRRHRGCAHAAPRARHGVGREARGPRDDGGARRLHRHGRRPGAMVGIGCETEPVSKNDEFQAFAEKVLRRRPRRG